MNLKPHLFGLTPEDLLQHINPLDDDAMNITEARRLQAHILGDGKMDFILRNPIRKSLQKKLAENFEMAPLKILERIEDPNDKCVRYLFESTDGTLIEAVRIPLLKQGHFSVCLSSQAGCAMACDFCATGRLGLKRNLEVWEIISQFIQVREEAPGRLSCAVFMGQGEPFHNYENVIKAAKILSSPSGCRVESKKITISTVGLVPQIKRFTEEKQPFRLIISLTSAIAEKRKSMLPIASKWSLQELSEAIKNYAQSTKDKITLAWVLIKDFNSGLDEVKAIKELFDGVPFKFNMIDVNDARPNGYQRATDAERTNFFGLLQELKIPIVRRYSVGNSRQSACGMLASRRLRDLAIEESQSS